MSIITTYEFTHQSIFLTQTEDDFSMVSVYRYDPTNRLLLNFMKNNIYSFLLQTGAVKLIGYDKVIRNEALKAIKYDSSLYRTVYHNGNFFFPDLCTFGHDEHLAVITIPYEPLPCYLCGGDHFLGNSKICNACTENTMLKCMIRGIGNVHDLEDNTVHIVEQRVCEFVDRAWAVDSEFRDLEVTFNSLPINALVHLDGISFVRVSIIDSLKNDILRIIQNNEQLKIKRKRNTQI